MLERLFSKLNQGKKSDKDANAATDAAAQPETLAKTSADEWKSHQQKVSSKSRNLYTVEDDPNEQALNGDGYSVKNGKIKSASTRRRNSMNSSKKMKKREHLSSPIAVLSMPPIFPRMFPTNICSRTAARIRTMSNGLASATAISGQLFCRFWLTIPPSSRR